MRVPLQGVELTLSRYVLTAELPNGDLRVFSTLWNSVVDLDYRHQRLLRGETYASTSEEQEHLDTLKGLGILVDKSVDEVAVAVEELKRRKRAGSVSMTYCVTSRCNFNCVYCVQEGKYGPETEMPPEIRRRAVGFSIEMLEHQGGDSLDVVFYGGEPLLNYDGILDMMFQLHCQSRTVGVKELSFGVVTNGSLLSPARLEVLRLLGLGHMQITVDGLPDTHNARRRTNNGSWGKVWETILTASSQGIHTTVNVVVDSQNVGELSALLDVADRIASARPDLKTHLVWIFGMLIPTRPAFARCHQVLFGKEPEIFAKIMDTYLIAKKRGWRVLHPLVQAVDSRESHRSFAIAPNGKVYKCFGVIGLHEYAIGDIGQPVGEVDMAGQLFADRDAWDGDCLTCSIFPLCRGGCQAIASLEHDGKFGHKLCERGFRIANFQRVLPGVF